jgi:cysteine synthase
MPDDVAAEKVHALEALGADVQRVRPASIVDKKQVLQILRFYPACMLIKLPPVCCKWKPSLALGYALNFRGQNLAKQRALDFGLHHDGQDGYQDKPHLIPTTSRSVVVTTSASEPLETTSLRDKEKIEHEPRGFFADQFEVGCPLNRMRTGAHKEPMYA